MNFGHWERKRTGFRNSTASTKSSLCPRRRISSAVGGVAGAVGGVIGKIPGMASGGPVSQGQAYVVGERGPELFVPGRNGTIIPNTSTPGLASGGGGGTVVNVNLPNYLGSPQEVAQVIRRELIQIGRRNGDILGGLA